MNKIVILFVLIGGGLLWASSQKANYFQVNQIGSSAKMISQGSVKGFSNTASVIFDNPASLGFIDKWAVSIFKTTLMADLNYRNLAAGYKTRYGTWGIGYMDLKVGEIPKTSRVGNRNIVDHYFDYTNSVVKVGYQNKMTKNLYYGALWSIFKTDMDTVKGEGSNIDMGLYWKLKKIDISLAMKNIIKTKGVNYIDTEEGENSSDGEREYLPLEFVMGARYRIWDLNILGQVKKVKEGKALKNIGLSYQPSFFKYLRLSVGQRQIYLVRYKDLREEEVVISVQSIGVGLSVKKISFDYAYEHTDHVNKADSNRHYFSMALNY